MTIRPILMFDLSLIYTATSNSHQGSEGKASFYGLVFGMIGEKQFY